eukprot:CFRG4136T1
MAYSLGVQFISEMLGMMIAIWLGESLLACELLAKSKGAHMGITGVAIGFGLAFFIPIQMFGHISATLNPCMMFAKWVCGKKTTEAWLVLSCADFLGAFLGANIVYAMYFAHFALIPDVPCPEKLDKMRYANTTSKEAYISNPDGKVDTSNPVAIRFSKPQKEVGRRVNFQDEDGRQHISERFHSLSAVIRRGSSGLAPVVELTRHSASKLSASAKSTVLEEETNDGCSTASLYQKDKVNCSASTDENIYDQSTTVTEQDMPAELIAYEKLLVQDQNAKLSVFATRPAVYNRATNFVTEVLGTIALTWFALMMEEREYLMPNEEAGQYFTNGQVSFLIGWLVTGCVLSFVGPTGYSANSARDLGPRFAHWLLPIPNKGPSEWHYAVVSGGGPYIGALFGGLFMVAARQMNQYPEWSWEKVKGQTMFGGLTTIF